MLRDSLDHRFKNKVRLHVYIYRAAKAKNLEHGRVIVLQYKGVFFLYISLI